MTTALPTIDSIANTTSISTTTSTDPAQVIPAVAGGIAVPGEVGPTRLHLPDGLSFGDWKALGGRLCEIERGRLWWLGDWCIYGEGRYGAKYTEVIDATDYDYQTVANAKYVAGRFEFSRRRENLSWSHHAEVASLDPAEADQWLDRAAIEHWSQKTLRAEIGVAATRRMLEEDAAAPPITEPPTSESDIESQQEIETPNTDKPDDDQGTGGEEGVGDDGDAPDGDRWVQIELQIETTIAALQDDANALRQVNVALLARHPDATDWLDQLGDALSVLDRFCNALKQAIADEAAGDGDAPHHPEEHHGDQ
jgi:hypothetical protein